ncbi:MAG: hypothetical protein HY757_01205 [Nitrospirae bacterium]|nr:hypothetical protein [Nitrospirota bacterium]
MSHVNPHIYKFKFLIDMINEGHTALPWPSLTGQLVGWVELRYGPFSGNDDLIPLHISIIYTIFASRNVGKIKY